MAEAPGMAACRDSLCCQHISLQRQTSTIFIPSSQVRHPGRLPVRSTNSARREAVVPLIAASHPSSMSLSPSLMTEGQPFPCGILLPIGPGTQPSMRRYHTVIPRLHLSVSTLALLAVRLGFFRYGPILVPAFRNFGAVPFQISKLCGSECSLTILTTRAATVRSC